MWAGRHHESKPMGIGVDAASGLISEAPELDIYTMK